MNPVGGRAIPTNTTKFARFMDTFLPQTEIGVSARGVVNDYLNPKAPKALTPIDVLKPFCRADRYTVATAGQIIAEGGKEGIDEWVSGRAIDIWHWHDLVVGAVQYARSLGWAPPRGPRT